MLSPVHWEVQSRNPWAGKVSTASQCQHGKWDAQYLRNSSELHHNGTGHRTSPFNSLSGTAGVYAPGTSCLCELLERQPIFILDYKLCGTVMTLQRSVLISSPVLERQSCWYVAVRHDGLRTKSSARPLSAQGSQMFSQRHGNGSLDPAGIDLGQGNSYDLSDHGNKKLERSIKIRPASAGGLVGCRAEAWRGRMYQCVVLVRVEQGTSCWGVF